VSKIQTRLFADVDALEATMGPILASGCDALVLFALGFTTDDFLSFAKLAPVGTPVLLADCYGILGFAEDTERNMEFMEAGRGQEYGGVGGEGGQGVVAVAFTGGDVIATIDSLPAEGVIAHMVIARSGSDVTGFLEKRATAPYYGGLAKATFVYAHEQEEFQTTPYFFVSSATAAGHTVGLTSFNADAKAAVQALLDGTPSGEVVDTVGLFPCFMRGVNEYGVSNVEPDVISELLPGVPVYGMFCHGELGPGQCLGFDAADKPQQSCRLHSGITIVAAHAGRGG